MRFAAALGTLLAVGHALAYTVGVGTYVCNPGAEVNVAVDLDSAEGLSFVSARISYDPQMLVFREAKVGTLGACMDEDFTVTSEESGVVTVGLFGISNVVEAAGSIAVLTFGVRERTELLYSDVTVSDVQLGEMDGVKDVTVGNPLTTVNGMVRIMSEDAAVDRLENDQVICAGTRLKTLSLKHGDGIAVSEVRPEVSVAGAVTTAGEIPMIPPETGWRSGEYRLLATSTGGLPLRLAGLAEGDSYAISEKTENGLVLYEASVQVRSESMQPVAEPVLTNTITYVNLQGAVNTNATEFTTNDLPLVLGPVECEGYRFLSWTPNDGVIPAGTVTNVTFVAKWRANTYSVKFNANGGVGTMTDDSMTYDVAKALTACAFTRTGYSFVGWATSANGEVVYANKKTVKNLTATQGAVINLYAKWTANEYTVKFNANGGSGTMANEPMTYDVTKALTACAFTRKGYTFAGWARDAATGMSPPLLADAEVVSNLTAEADGVVTLYAKWTPNNYVIDFNPGQGGTGTMPDQPMMYDEEAALYANLFARTGYSFLGWTDDESELEEVLFYDGVVVSNLTDEVDGEFDLYAVWAANEYTVRFNANGGEGAMAEMGFLYDEAQSLPMNAFTRTGYTFAGWAREAATGMSPPQLADAEVVSNLTAEADGVVTLYAVWTANPYTIRFNANGGEGSMTDQAFLYDEVQALLANAFTRTGYAFAGWACDAATGMSPPQLADAEIVSNLTAEANGVVTLYAVWQAGANAVSFDGNGGTPSEASRSVLTDAKVGALPSATRTGWTLVGWFTAASGGTQVSADTVITAAVTFFAQWTGNVYTVKFDANGGEGTMADEPMTYDAEKALTACAFTRKGYAFAGWAREAATGMSPPQLADGAVVSNLTAEADGVVTLYAVWDNTGLLDEDEAHVDVAKGEVAPYEDAAAVYDGYLYDGETVVGSVQVKVARGKVDKKSGEFSAKVTATVQMAGQAKKLSFKGGVADEKGAVTRMSVAEHELDVTVGVKGLGGTFDGKYKIDGARNVFSGKSAADKDAAGMAASRYLGVYNVAFDGGTLSVSVDKKGKAKIAGTVEGNKVSATSQLAVGKDAAVVPVVIVKKVNLAFCLWITADGKAVEVRGADPETSGKDSASPFWLAGKAGALKAGAKFGMDEAAVGKMKGWLRGLYADYLPRGLAVAQDGKKWTVADGAKAGKLVLDKETGKLDLTKSKITDNTAGLKLTYKEKDGTFKGSFKAYNLENGKIKAYTASVTGVLIGEKGYGTATIKKLGTVAVSIAKYDPVDDLPDDPAGFGGEL